MNLKILQELHLKREETLELLKKLVQYKYVDEMDDLKYGTYIRWIPLANPNYIELKKGAIFCNIKITDEILDNGLIHYIFNKIESNKNYEFINLDISFIASIINI